MSKTRTQKALYNTATSLLSEVVALLCGLILPRLILRRFGSAYNGISSSVAQMLSAVSILSVGITGSTRVALYRSLAAHDREKTSGIIKATELYMRKVGYVLLCILGLLVIFYPILKDTGYSWVEVAPLVVASGIGAAGQYFFGMTYSTLLMADQSVYVSNILLILCNLLNLIVSVILIRLGCSIQAVKLVSSLVLVLNPILRSVYVKKKYDLDRNAAPDNSALAMRKDVMAHSIANIVHDHTDIIVLTVFCDIEIVSVYTVYNLVMHALKKTQSVFTSGTEAIFGNMWAKQENAKIREYLGLFEYIMGVFASLVFSTTFIMILPFVSLYTKGVTDAEYFLPAYAAVITAAQMFFSFRTPYLVLIDGAGHYKQTKKAAYEEAVINLTTSIVFVQFFGIVGVAIGTLIANVFRTVQFALYIDNHLVPRGKHVFITRILWAVSNVAAIVGVCYLLGFEENAGRGWMTWILYSLCAVAAGAVIIFVSSLIFYRKDMISMVKVFKRALTRRRKKNA